MYDNLLGVIGYSEERNCLLEVEALGVITDEDEERVKHNRLEVMV